MQNKNIEKGLSISQAVSQLASEENFFLKAEWKKNNWINVCFCVYVNIYNGINLQNFLCLSDSMAEPYLVRTEW